MFDIARHYGHYVAGGHNSRYRAPPGAMWPLSVRRLRQLGIFILQALAKALATALAKSLVKALAKALEGLGIQDNSLGWLLGSCCSFYDT